MNAGKSTTLLQASFNYHERGMKALIFTAAIDRRAGEGIVASRIGLSEAAWVFDGSTNLFEKFPPLLKPAAPIASSSTKHSSCCRIRSCSSPARSTT